MANRIIESQPLDADSSGYGAREIRATRVALNDLGDEFDAHVAADIKPTTSYKTANYTITDIDLLKRIEVGAISADVTITLPLKANNPGRRIEITYISGGSYKVIIVPHATDVTASHMISNDNLAVIWLSKVGDRVTLQESANSGFWEVVDESITSQLTLDAYTGHGLVDTAIMRFSTVIENYGNMFSENHSSGYTSNKGLEITINRSGRYSFLFTNVVVSGGGKFGLSINSNQLSTSILTINSANRLVLIIGGTSGEIGLASATLYCKKGDVIRPHDDGAAPTAAYPRFSCTYLGR